MKLPFPLLSNYIREEKLIALFGYLIALDLVKKETFTPDLLFSEFSKRFDIPVDEGKSRLLNGYYDSLSMLDLGMLEYDKDSNLKVVPPRTFMKRNKIKSKKAWMVEVNMEELSSFEEFANWIIGKMMKAAAYKENGSKVNFFG